MLESAENTGSTRELERQINSLLYERLALSKDRENVLEFYNYVLKCFVFIDLKVGKLTHQDIGQMDIYVRYFENVWRLVE
ncbi:putative nuclease [Candidatus Methanophagaceae archaeon]|jgi:predicted nuclease of restriction endonuclease-like (RecB) superfamily|nr:putative nuclease [Methanophagales archaeon]